MARFRNRVDWIVLLILSLAPLAVFIYLGSQSRPVGDDYWMLGKGRDLGSWESILYWRGTWTGTYSDFFLHSLVAPLRETASRIMPAIIMIIWIIALAAIVFQGLRWLKIGRHRLIISVVFAAFTVGATVNGILSPLSIYYYLGAVKYLLPMALLTVYAAAALLLIPRINDRRQLAVAALAGSIFCFFNAGFSEMFLVYQLAFITLALAAFILFMRGRIRRAALTFFGGGWLASFASFLIQVSAPGVANRHSYAQDVLGDYTASVAQLILDSLAQTLQLVFDVDIFAGFVLLLFLGLYTTLSVYRPGQHSGDHEPIRITRRFLLFGFLAQLLSIPFIYSHTSDLPQALGKYSYAYSIVFVINGGLLVGLGILLVYRQRINAWLADRQSGAEILALAALLILLILFALTQIRSIHWKAFAFLFISSHIILAMLAWLLAQKSLQRKLATFAVCVYGACLALNNAAILPEIYTHLRVIPRTLTMLPYSMVLLGLLWGVLIGYGLKQRSGSSSKQFMRGNTLRQVSFCAVMLISIAIVGRNANLIPSFETFAREWDARQDHIIAERDSGKRVIAVSPLSFDLGTYMKQIKPFLIDPHAPYYYGVEAFVMDDA